MNTFESIWHLSAEQERAECGFSGGVKMLETWKEIVVEAPAFYIGWGGLLIGLLFGYIVYITNFCTMGSISDILSFGDYRRFRSWLLAGAVGMIGVAGLQGVGVADFADSMYLLPNLNWLANVSGGLIFGFGMVFAGGCISRNLVRAGSGDLRSLVVLMITGLFGYMTIGGLLGPLRVAVFSGSTVDLTEMGLESQGSGAILAAVSGMSLSSASTVALVVLVGAIVVFCFKDSAFRNSPMHLIAGVGIGLCIVAGWLLTGLAQDDFADTPVALISLSYVRPTGDAMDYLMRSTALGAPGFGVVTLAGALLGGFFGALSKGRLHLTTFADKKDSIRNMFGAALMGIGGVLALGCTVGQGLTGVSTLAVGSFITLAFIILGGMAGVKSLEWFLLRD
ncbi:MAG: YeeE/YedE family protein [Rhodobacteraceae bacterium]|nr:YeeE/YedE family protein [Paracoccaceae bacterium]